MPTSNATKRLYTTRLRQAVASLSRAPEEPSCIPFDDLMVSAVCSLPAETVADAVVGTLGLDLREIYRARPHSDELCLHERPGLWLEAQHERNPVLRAAHSIARSVGDWHIGTEHVVAAAAQTTTTLIAAALSRQGIRSSALVHAIRTYRPANGWFPHVRGEITSPPSTGHDPVGSPRLSTYLIHELCAPRPYVRSRASSCAADLVVQEHVRGQCPQNAEIADSLQAGSRTLRQSRQSHWLRQLCERTDVHEVHCGPVVLYMTTCSDIESTTLEGFGSQVFSSMAETYRDYLRLGESSLSVVVICLGAKADLDELPSELRAVIDREDRPGLYADDLRVVVLNMAPIAGQHLAMKRAIVHEVTHAMLAELSSQFVFPAAIAEGFATAMEHRFAEDRSLALRLPWPSVPVPQTAGAPCLQGYLTARELLTASRDRVFEGWAFHYASYRLLLYLAILNHASGALCGFLNMVLRSGLVGEKLLSSITFDLDLTESGFESGFKRFCLGAEDVT